MPTPANSLTVTALSLVNAAGQEIGALAAGEQFDTDNQAWVLQKLQRVIDTANARRVMVYTNIFSQFTLIPNLAPHTIGPSGSLAGPSDPAFLVTQRPVEIPTISLILPVAGSFFEGFGQDPFGGPPGFGGGFVGGSGGNVEIPLNRRDKNWWADQRVKNLTSTIPTDYYYEPDWPVGNIFFWPVPNAGYNVLLQLRTIFAELTAPSQTFTMPPAYWDWIVYKTAIAIGPSFERQISPDLRQLMMEAERAVQGNNIKSPRADTADAGMPGSGIIDGLFNYYSGAPK